MLTEWSNIVLANQHQVNTLKAVTQEGKQKQFLLDVYPAFFV